MRYIRTRPIFLVALFTNQLKVPILPFISKMVHLHIFEYFPSLSESLEYMGFNQH